MFQRSITSSLCSILCISILSVSGDFQCLNVSCLSLRHGSNWTCQLQISENGLISPRSTIEQIDFGFKYDLLLCTNLQYNTNQGIVLFCLTEMGTSLL